eukprot:SAG31_NODE_1067_length_10080_cov_26.831580_6_plen_152_part_00
MVAAIASAVDTVAAVHAPPRARVVAFPLRHRAAVRHRAQPRPSRQERLRVRQPVALVAIRLRLRLWLGCALFAGTANVAIRASTREAVEWHAVTAKVAGLDARAAGQGGRPKATAAAAATYSRRRRRRRRRLIVSVTLTYLLMLMRARLIQ